MLLIEKLSMKNFKTYVDAEFDFLEGHNIIIGDNGAGKTSIFEAIMYSLFGSVPNKKAEFLIRMGETSSDLSLTFSVDGKRYLVGRKIRRSGSEATLHRHPNKIVAEKSKTVTQEIEKLLGVSANAFGNIVYIPQGEISQIASEQPSKRKWLFDKLLGFATFQELFEKLREITKAAEISIKEYEKIRNEWASDVEKLPDEQEDLKNLKEELKSYKEELKIIKPIIKNLKEEFSSYKQDNDLINELTAREDAQLENISRIKDQIENSKQEIEKLTNITLIIEDDFLADVISQFHSEKATIEEITEKIKLEIEKQKDLKSQLKNLRAQIEKESKNIDKTTEKSIKSHENLVSKKPEIKSISEEQIEDFLERESNSIESEIATLESLRKEIQEIETSRTEFKTTIDNLSKEIQKNNKKLTKKEKAASKSSKNWEMIFKNLNEIDFENEIQKIEQQIEQFLTTREQESNQLHQVQKKVEEINEELLEIEQLKTGVTCPKCKQKVTGTHKNKIIQESNDLIEQLKIKEQEIEEKKALIEDALESAKKVMEDLQNKRSKFSKLSLIVSEIESIKSNIEEFTTELQTAQQNLENLPMSDINTQEVNQKIKQLYERLNSEKEMLKEYHQIVELKETIKIRTNEINTLREQYKKLEMEFDEKKLTEDKKQLEEKEEQYKKLILLISDISNLKKQCSENKACEDEYTKTKEQLDVLQKRFDSAEFQRLEEELDNLKHKQTELKTKIDFLAKKSIPEKEDRIHDLEEKMKELKGIDSKLDTEKLKYESATIVRQFCREIVPILRTQYVDEISEYATEIFTYLIGNDEYEKITITEDYDLLIHRSGRAEPLIMLSGGEQVIACISIRMAIARLLANQDILILDEPTSMLDTQRRKDLVMVFERTRPTKQTLVVTHDSEFERVADAVFHITKQGGRSQVISESITQTIKDVAIFKALTQERFQSLEL